ncbi:acyltransferase family protein [Halomonas binhaiensis]|uniref:Acyltransferase n=1 Tax=Halomonas binhaiensis TaxID=2562282 RepID=A0A856QJV1_9GAMM|nr:acyltransferase [Halomonas binhaiensis]QEM80209.2 acyltransferase [Halomonas binhaiensis]
MEDNLILSMMLIYAVCITWSYGLARVFKPVFLEELSDKSRNSSMDGVRGFAAISVFLHHSVYSYNLYTYQAWGPSTEVAGTVLEKYLWHLGSFSVSLFFMITAYLFWRMVLMKRENMDWSGFYRNRIFRIVPLYVVIVCMVFAIFHVVYKGSGDSKFASSFIAWLGFGFLPLPSVNNYPASWSIVAGVFWTLAIEWKFYLTLPFLALFAKSKASSGVSLFVAAAGMVALHKLGLMEHNKLAIASCFVLGALAAHLSVYNSRAVSQIPRLAATTVAILAFTYSLVRFGDVYKLKAEVVTFLFFFAVVECGAMKAIFSSMAMRFLGIISYSIYLCHGLVLTVINGFIVKNSGYLIPSASALLAVIGFSTALYLYVERPFIQIGKKQPVTWYARRSSATL